MRDPNNPVVSVNIPAVQFESNKDFQNKSLLYERDSGFLRFRHKLIYPQGDSQANREILTTLLATQGDNSSTYVEKLISENILYRDLGSLTHQDLELMGISRPKQRDELLEFFAQLPNQDPSLDQIYNLQEAANYNRQILNNASNHLGSMQSALAAANYKLQIVPPEDVIVGEKSFASRFVLEALNELYGVTDEIERELSEVDKIASNKVKSLGKDPDKTPRGTNLFLTTCLILGSLSSMGILLGLYYWKFKK